MKNYTTEIILLFISLSFLLSCRKEDLPTATEKGKNTFGCKINGKTFVPQQTITFPSMDPLRGSYISDRKHFELSVSEDRDKSNNLLQRYFFLKVYNIKLGNNTLNEENKAEVNFSQKDQLDQHYQTNITTEGTITVTRLDTVAHIISGTFFF